ncbi:cell division protein FtsW (lipid II flippase) [Microbacterium sp. SORGH_AS 421]|nr:FtsW/RodA/SpoVE family cell cycle protein [Microbacterium sp. SORGH_AS_0421]MDQ1177532.1 cell division protein FtsW (lipid II flippase) [Microbacterium sp. SORGH_AS_0421]
MTTTAPPPRRTPDEPERTGLAARVSLGRAFRPVPSEFLLITSAALLLTGFGLVMVLSATSALDGAQNPFEHVIKQGVFAVIGVPLMFVLSRAPLRFWKRMAWPALILATLFPAARVHPPGYLGER